VTGRPMRYRLNPHRLRAVVPRPPRDAVRAFHRALPGYAPTPLRTLPGLAAALGLGALQVKDESGRLGLGAFKALGATWALHRLRERGAQFDTVSTATDGNHGRAVAWTARQLGLRAVIFMTTHTAPARVAAVRAERAEVVLVDGTYDDAVRLCAARSGRAGWQVVADVGYDAYLEVPRWITEGYGTLLDEAAEQRRASGLSEPDVVLVQAGVGGLAAAVVEHFLARERQPVIIAVEPVDADPLLESALTPDARPAPSTGHQRSFMACLNAGEVSRAAWAVLRTGVDLFISIEDRYAMDAMRRLAHPAGDDPRLVAGEAGAAGLAGLLALLDAPALAPARDAAGLTERSTVMLFVTEGATDPATWTRVTGLDGLP
jgi:diaminopropionate ammonia-lyase